MTFFDLSDVRPPPSKNILPWYDRTALSFHLTGCNVVVRVFRIPRTSVTLWNRFDSKFHWDPKPDVPIVNQRCCNYRGSLVPYGISFGPFVGVIADDHYVLIPSVTGKGPAVSSAILSKGEPALYCCIVPLALVLDVVSATNPVKTLPNFRKGLVHSKMSIRTSTVLL
ncbi:hypothetical protein Zmor_021722 [Zophobas morio]|uniref:Uncharacterized protein n=1 Tax=Zophobas morio TaxID=2755281 RepID=A0AA38I9Q5_9CUCU|nr:hypothetical protein Zmor_021722 [Zophobas morio]